MVNPSSHKTPNGISGAALIFGNMLICIVYLLGPGSWSVAICDNSIVLTSGSLDIISYDIISGAISGVACLDRFMFEPESAIACVYLLG